MPEEQKTAADRGQALVQPIWIHVVTIGVVVTYVAYDAGGWELASGALGATVLSLGAYAALKYADWRRENAE